MEEELRVQEIATSSGDTIPAEFVRSETEQPAITTVHGETLSIPIIDLSQADEENLLQQIVDASRDWGMFQIVNHGIPTDAIAKLQKVGRQFFELPAEEKEKYAKPPDSKSIEGYGTKLQKELEGRKAWVDHLFHRVWPPSAINYQFWPQIPPDYREVNEEYTEHLHGVVNRLFRYMSMGLGLEEDEVKKAVGGEQLIYLMKINYYPTCPRPDLALGVPAHSDMSALTLLVPNHVQGLQAQRHQHWYDVVYVPDAIVVHIGDQLEILSNGMYRAVYHRSTVNKEKVRISWPVFLEPPPDFEVGPHPKMISEQNQAKYKTKKFSDYCYCKLNKIPQ